MTGDTTPPPADATAAYFKAAKREARDQAIKECAGRLRVLHRLTGETANYCAEDGFTWPCRTERLLRGLSTPQARPTMAKRLRVYIEPRDAWIGCYVATDVVYVCPLPFLVIRWQRKSPGKANDGN